MRSFLAFIGRHATVAFALSIVMGLALPQLASLLKPFIPISIFTFIVLSFARAHVAGVKSVLAKPGRLVLALLWSSIVPPLIGWLTILAIGTETIDPGLRLAIALMAAAPPLMASPAYAAVLGFENSLALAILVLGMVLTPLASPLLASAMAGAHVPLEPAELALRLLIFVGGGIAFGLVLRRFFGAERFVALKTELDGFNVILFFLFAIAAMDGVIDATLKRPAEMAFYLALSTGLNVMGFAITYALWARLGFNDRFTLSISIGLRNMGLLIAPILALVPQSTFLYFALAQVPIYCAPMILKALRDRLVRKTAPEMTSP